MVMRRGGVGNILEDPFLSLSLGGDPTDHTPTEVGLGAEGRTGSQGQRRVSLFGVGYEAKVTHSNMDYPF